jgi:hypothetical protein
MLWLLLLRAALVRPAQQGAERRVQLRRPCCV